MLPSKCPVPRCHGTRASLPERQRGGAHRHLCPRGRGLDPPSPPWSLGDSWSPRSLALRERIGKPPQECCAPLGVPHPTEALGSFLTLSSPHSTARGDRAGSAAPIPTPAGPEETVAGLPVSPSSVLWALGSGGLGTSGGGRAPST